jgi:transposase
MPKRHELSDAQWALIEDLFPPERGRVGHPWREHRTMLNGIFWILTTGAPWRDLPERYGPWQSVYDRFTRYRRDGTFERMLERLRLELDAKGLIDMDTWFADASIVRASKAAAGGRKGGASQKTTHSGALVAASRRRSI